MSESRQPGDQKRFTLSKTAEGPRFVLATKKDAASMSETTPAPDVAPVAPAEAAPEATRAPRETSASESTSAISAPTVASQGDVPAAPKASAPAAPQAAAPPRTPKLPPLPPQKVNASRADNGKRKAKNGRHEPYVSKARRAEMATGGESVSAPAPAAPVAAKPAAPAPAAPVAAKPAAPAPAAPVAAKPAAPAPAAPVAAKPAAPAPAAPVAAKPAAPAPATLVAAKPAAPAPAARPELRPAAQEAPTQTHTVLDAERNDRLPTAFWKAALPPQAEAVAADYTVDAGVERVHAPVATPEEAIGLMKDAASPIPDASSASPFFSEHFARAGQIRVPRVVIAALVLLLFGVTLMVRLLPEPSPQNVLTARAERAPMGRARLAQSNSSRLFARGLDGELQKALESGMYVVVARKDDGTMSNEAIVEDLMTRDLESAQKLARIKSEALSQPLFIIARRNGEVAVVERVNPGDRQAWRDYSMSVWYLKQHALAWPRERYMSREALDSKQTLAIMSDFVRSHPDSRVVGSALEDIRYVCYYNLQDPAKFRDVALGLLDESLAAYDRQRGGNVPELVYVMKPYLKEAMNQFLYQRIHRITSEQAALEPAETGALGSSFTSL